MSILSDDCIQEYMDKGLIKIDPFRHSCLGPNSYDLHLGNLLKMYDLDNNSGCQLDCKKKNEYFTISIPEEGFVLKPNTLYLGVTEEYTEASDFLVPYIDGKSSIGRLGIFIHITAGRGDAGFKGYWTLEIVCVNSVRIYSGMPIGQIYYEEVTGLVLNPYDKKKSSKYVNNKSEPVTSKMYKNWDKKNKTWL